MTKLETIAFRESDAIREGLNWVVVWKVGRYWDSAPMYIHSNGKLSPGAVDMVNVILEADPNAIMIHGRRCGHIERDASVEEVAFWIRTRYEMNRYRLTSSAAYTMAKKGS